MLAVWLPLWILVACAVAIGVAWLVRYAQGTGKHNALPGHALTMPVLAAQMAAERLEDERKAEERKAEEAAAAAAARAACESTQIDLFRPRRAA